MPEEIYRIIEKRRKWQSREGFTLTEILIVIAVIGILVVVLVPIVQNYVPHLALREETKKVVAKLKEAQQLAVSEQVIHIVSFDLTNNHYKLKRWPDPQDPNSLEELEDIALENNIDFQQVIDLTNNEVQFNVIGSPSDSGKIILENIKNNTLTVEIRPSGFVKFY